MRSIEIQAVQSFLDYEPVLEVMAMGTSASMSLPSSWGSLSPFLTLRVGVLGPCLGSIAQIEVLDEPIGVAWQWETAGISVNSRI